MLLYATILYVYIYTYLYRIQCFANYLFANTRDVVDLSLLVYFHNADIEVFRNI